MFVVFAVVFVAKARSARAFDDFARSLSQFGIRSIPGQWVVAALVLLLEALASIGLVMLAHHPVVRYALPVVLLLGFSAGVALSARSGRLAACHCFGTSTELPVPAHLALNCSLAGWGCLAAVTGGSAGSTGDTVLGTGLGAITGVLFAASADLYMALSTGSTTGGRTVSEGMG